MSCSAGERRAFERLVRRGFHGSDESLYGRICVARRLAFHYATETQLVAIAGMKTPAPEYRDHVFRMAQAPIPSTDYDFELGWVFVLPAQRGRGIGGSLCHRLLAAEAEANVFSMTRPENATMMRILGNLGFARVGKPYRRRNEELALFVRPRFHFLPRA